MISEDEKITEPALPVAVEHVPESDGMRFARAGYVGYARFTGGKTFDGREMPLFEALEQRIKDAWAAAAAAVFTEFNRPPGMTGVSRERLCARAPCCGMEPCIEVGGPAATPPSTEPA